MKGDAVQYLDMVAWRINAKLQHRQGGRWSLLQKLFQVLDRWHTKELTDWTLAVCMVTDQTHSDSDDEQVGEEVSDDVGSSESWVPSEVSPQGAPAQW